jgi:DNA primase
MISEEKINEIIDKTDMVGLVSEFVTLQKRGKNYFGLCPFHADQTPSFSVSPSKKIAKCMSCGEGGNPINFLRKIKNVSFEEACFLLADRVGVQLERTKTVKHVDENSKYYEINQVAQKFYEHFLHNSQSGKEALEYLNKRGLDLETIKMFGIGLAPKNYTTLTKVLSDKGYSLTDAHDIGLITRKENDYYDMFFNRIMFPIIDEAGHVLGFSGRVFDGDTSGGKYVNTQETVIYKKGEMLYNLNNAIPHIRKMGRVILCEGQMDVISLSNAGIKEVV